jgi:UDP-N-acetyl-D-glucosamine dehydrogenase
MNVHVPTFPFHGDDDLASNFQGLTRKILQREAVIGVIGMGYVGLPGVGGLLLGRLQRDRFRSGRDPPGSLTRGASYLSHFA